MVVAQPCRLSSRHKLRLPEARKGGLRVDATTTAVVFPADSIFNAFPAGLEGFKPMRPSKRDSPNDNGEPHHKQAGP